jgi:sortase A
MEPDNSSPGGDLPTVPSRGAPPNDDRGPTGQRAAANVIRTQIDALYTNRHDYSRRPSAAAKAPVDSQPEPPNPYDRTHQEYPQPQAEQWKQYHTAWQNYYQQYYERYYTSELEKRGASSQPAEHYFSSQPTDAETTEEALTNDQALYELRQKLLGQVQTSARKIRRSRHFVPIIAALAVVLIFVFLQYNRVFVATVAAYVSPGNIDPQNIVIDPSSDVAVDPQDTRLIIPKINVDVPVIYDIGNDNDSQMAAMEKGVAHFAIPGASSHPGEVGNTVIAGHSSNDLFDGGDYKFIFAQLEKLSPGDSIYANYKGTRYTYVITRTEVVKPNEVNKLVYATDKPVMTLITCTPLGTALNRLLITAEQVSPDPSSAAAAPNDTTSGSVAIPGNSPTLLERLFGAR